MASKTARPWTKGYPGLVESADENWINNYQEK
jgi:hypothetical protein